MRAPGRRGEVYLVDLGVTRGREIRKTRPCVIVSPDELNERLGTYIVAPLTSGAHAYAFRIASRFGGRDGHILVDQLRTVDHRRLIKPLGMLNSVALGRVLSILRILFEE